MQDDKPRVDQLPQAWFQFLLSFLVNLFAAVVFVLVINRMVTWLAADVPQ